LLPPPVAVSNDEPVEGAKVPLIHGDLPDAKPGEMIFHEPSSRLLVKIQSGWKSVALDPGVTGPVIQSQFALDSYISFVLMLALAFGLAFETPLAVYFLGSTGLVSIESMSKSRRFVILGVVIFAAIVTPTPDVINQLLLAGPMYLLFELGLYAVRFRNRSRSV